VAAETRLNGQRVLIIGASAGLGRAVGMGLARQGVRVALAARRTELVEAAAKEAGANAIGVTCDVCDEASCQAAVKTTVEQFGGLDAVIYTAALDVLAMLEDVTADVWSQAFATNVIGAASVTRAALPHLKESHGKAIYFSSNSGPSGPPWQGLGVYGVTKAGLERLVESLANEHPDVAFTRLVLGVAAGDPSAPSQFGSTWDPDLAAAVVPKWSTLPSSAEAMITPQDLTSAIATILESKAHIPSLTILSRD
jgi:NAD(P)-dependent dehydrogenase (short-subunit alcohol dehydrogenase family)